MPRMLGTWDSARKLPSPEEKVPVAWLATRLPPTCPLPPAAHSSTWPRAHLPGWAPAVCVQVCELCCMQR